MLLRTCRLRPSCRSLASPSFPATTYSRSSSQDLSFASLDKHMFARSAPFPKRTHTCGQLTAADVGSRVTLCGWLLPQRKGKLVSFFPLKDSYGTIQLTVNHNNGNSDITELGEVPPESVVVVQGTVLLRPPSARRTGPTGEIDVQVEKFSVLNPANPNLPFLPSNPRDVPNDELRARFRHLDLRRPALTDNLKRRSRVTQIIRSTLYERDFLEVETPILLRSSPEGAREFLVPSRTISSGGRNSPLFYALSQSPQQPKQLLICSGIDKYYQFARCFRDEDGRKDRQPEFTQVDLEMAFVSWGEMCEADTPHSSSWRIGGTEVRDVVETLIKKIWLDVEGTSLANRFKTITYHTAMMRYGSDKPDTRFGLEIINLMHLLPPALQTFLESSDEILECLVVPRNSKFIHASRECKVSSTERISLTEENISTWLLASDVCSRQSLGISSQGSSLNERLRLMPGDDVWLSRRKTLLQGGSTTLGKLRLQLSELAQARGDFKPSEVPHFLWVTEFPLFTRADKDKDLLAHGRWASSHHPFTAPMWQDIDVMYNGHWEAVRGQHYDLVLNGVEIGGGSVRIHDAAMQQYLFTEILQLTEVERAPFDHLLRALKCGAPPHGGIALGFDRLMAILCKTHSIRDVIAFPKTSVGTDPFFKSPAPVSTDVLEQYGLRPR